MDSRQRITALVRRVADLLPAPPPADDRAGYQAWEDLVLTTVARLKALAGVEGGPPATLGPRVRHRLDSRALLSLASVELPEGSLRPGI